MTKAIPVFRSMVLPIVLTAAATAASWLFSDGVAVPIYIFFMAAVLGAAYVGRWRAALLTIALSTVSAVFFLVPPRFELTLPDHSNSVRLLAFILLSLAGTALIERLHYLLERERLLNAIVSTTPALTVLTDNDGRILMFNRHCEELTGYRQDEVLGKTIPELFLDDEWIQTVKERFRTLDVDALRKPHDNPWRTKDGKVRMIEWRCVVMPQPMQKPFVLGIGLDVTDMRDAHRRLRELDRLTAQWELASVIAHELHNPMQALANVFSLLQASQATDENWYDYLKMAETQLKRMADVSQRLTALRNETKAQSGAA